MWYIGIIRVSTCTKVIKVRCPLRSLYEIGVSKIYQTMLIVHYSVNYRVYRKYILNQAVVVGCGQVMILDVLVVWPTSCVCLLKHCWILDWKTRLTALARRVAHVREIFAATYKCIVNWYNTPNAYMEALSHSACYRHVVDPLQWYVIAITTGLVAELLGYPLSWTLKRNFHW